MITRAADMAKETREKMRGGNGSVQIAHWFKPSDFGAKVRMCAKMTLAPGCSIGTHTHNGEDEIYLVLSGKGSIEENGQWVPISEGDAILTGKGRSHGVANNSAEPLVIAAIIAQY